MGSVKPKSLKPEEIEEAFGVQESQEIEAVGEFWQDEPKSLKLKTNPTDNRKKSIKIQSQSNIESLDALDTEEMLQETIKPHSLKSDEIDEPINIKESQSI